MKKYLSIGGIILLALLWVTVAIVSAAYTDPIWGGGDPPAQLTDNGYNRYTAMAQAANGTVGLVWSRVAPDGRTGPRWLTLTLRTGDTWGTPMTLRTVMTDINQPAIAFLGNTWHVAWTEGRSVGPAQLMVTRQGGTPQVLHANIYKYPEPDMTSAANGLHMVYAAAYSINPPNHIPNLYYTFYPASGDAWLQPTVAITRSQVVTPGVEGEIWAPKIAVSADGSKVHLVWEQHIFLVGKTLYEVWYVQGTHQGTSVAWGTPRRVSPQGQNALRPDIVLDQNGYAHVVWTEAIGPLGRPDAQFVDYRAQTSNGWTIPKRIDPYNAAVSNLNPTYVQAAIAIRADRICVAWHGSRSSVEKEELLLTCSEDRGQTWQTTYNASNTVDKLSLYPNALFDAQGRLLLSWIESRTSNWFWDYDVFFRREKANLHRLYLPLTLRNKAS